MSDITTWKKPKGRRKASAEVQAYLSNTRRLRKLANERARRQAWRDELRRLNRDAETARLATEGKRSGMTLEQMIELDRLLKAER